MSLREPELVVYHYYRSSAAYRVRIALNLKGLEAEFREVDLTRGEQHREPYGALNPQHLVPALLTPHGALGQSLAILEYLDERYPQRPLLPPDPLLRAEQRALALTIACDMHPLQNLRVLNYLREELGQDEAAVRAWAGHWMAAGLASLEARAGNDAFLGGAEPMLGDVLLAPQLFNARRFEVDLTPYPRLTAIGDRCNALEPFLRAAPDAVKAG